MSIVPYNEALVKWTRAKKMADKMSQKMAQVEQLNERSERMKNCGSWLDFRYCPECGSLHIERANLCRDRLCPVCGWRLSLQRVAEMLQVLDSIAGESEIPPAGAMLTLTVKNCSVGNLDTVITQMLEAWGKLRKRKEFIAWVDGWARSVEITRATNGTYHPHIHALLLWKPEYNKNITQRRWCDMWRESCTLDYQPIVDIRTAYSKYKIKNTTKWEKLVAATVECTKYAIKPLALSSVPLNDLWPFAQAVKGKRLISYGGSIKRARHILGMRDNDKAADVTAASIECPKCGSTDTVLLAYRWAITSGLYELSPYPYSGLLE